jgi:hypothetical protein
VPFGKRISFSWWKSVEFACGTSLIAKEPDTRQTFVPLFREEHETVAASHLENAKPLQSS